MQNARLDEARIKIPGRNINNLRYSADTTLMTESKDELKSLLMKVKEMNEKVSLKFNIQKLRSWHLVHHFMAKRWGEKMETMTDCILSGSRIMWTVTACVLSHFSSSDSLRPYRL